jgi:VWFA-related protein
MVRTIFTLLVFASSSFAQSSSGGTSSIPYSQDADFSLSPSQMRGALASSVVQPEPAFLPIVRAEVQEVNLMFTVTNHRGHFVRNLEPSDFTIQDNGEPPQRITHFESQSELPFRLAIVIDRSDSVAYRFDNEKRSAAFFLERILRRTSDLALVIGFNQEVGIVQESTGDNKLLSHAIRKLRTDGDTAIYDAVSAASQQLARVKETQPVRRAIILITEGEDNSSHINLKQAEEDVQREECAVYVMSVNPEEGRNLPPSDLAMMELSEVTGGKLFRVGAEGSLEEAFANIDKQLRSQYLISYKPASRRIISSTRRLRPQKVPGSSSGRLFRKIGQPERPGNPGFLLGFVHDFSQLAQLCNFPASW